MQNFYKSFAFQLDSIKLFALTTDIYENIDNLNANKNQYWAHFESPSKNLQQRLSKKFNIPKNVKQILFADESRPRFVKFDNSYLLILQGIDTKSLHSENDFPYLRIWISENRIVSISNRQMQALQDLQLQLKKLETLSLEQCLSTIIEYVIYYIDEATYDLDENLYKIEINRQLSDADAKNIVEIRQNIIQLRRYIKPQRDALINFTTKVIENFPILTLRFKEFNDTMQRYVETVESLQDRAVVVQDKLSNQIGEVANQRMYILTVIMLIFTPAFFIMSLFSMYLPIPGMNSPLTWWAVVVLTFITSAGLFFLFKLKKWL